MLRLKLSGASLQGWYSWKSWKLFWVFVALHRHVKVIDRLICICIVRRHMNSPKEDKSGRLWRYLFICRLTMQIYISLSITLTWRYSATKTQNSFQDFQLYQPCKEAPKSFRSNMNLQGKCSNQSFRDTDCVWLEVMLVEQSKKLISCLTFCNI